MRGKKENLKDKKYKLPKNPKFIIFQINCIELTDDD